MTMTSVLTLCQCHLVPAHRRHKPVDITQPYTPETNYVDLKMVGMGSFCGVQVPDYCTYGWVQGSQLPLKVDNLFSSCFAD